MRTFIDRGGTFTDVVQVDRRGRTTISKVPSDAAVVGELAVGKLIFGTTVATNALLEGRGVPTLLLVSQGFADLPRLGDMSRPDIFDPDADWPAPLCLRVLEIGGRIAADGSELEPLEIPELDLEGIAAVAIVLINSHRNAAHEERVAAQIEGLHVSLGHRVSPTVGYLARVETTLVDAAITPILGAAMERDRIPVGALAMRSDGSLCPAEKLRAPDAVLSGPAGGVMAVAAVAEMAGFERAVGLDMGGTSTDVCRVDVGELPHREGDLRVAGVRLRRPMLEVETIAAGGGSILRNDGLRLSVGPDSAGADPGPACYGRGGPPTLTDAALLAGLLDPEAFTPSLEPGLAKVPGDPERFLDLARESMAAAVRRIATARGIDLKDHALVAYGGAAGQHATEVAERLGIRTVLVHPCASVLSAWGQALARREERAVRSIWQPLADAGLALFTAWAELEASLPELGEVQRSASLRYRGTDHALEVSGADLRGAFVAEHRRRYGFDREGEIEVVDAWVRARADAPALPLSGGDPFGIGSTTLNGPIVLKSPTTSILVGEGWSARMQDGLLRIENERPPKRGDTGDAAADVAIWGRRFMAVAEQGGEVLKRLARSVNIRERLDYSCAIFDRQGQLVANAPHIPVHLGAMGETVRDLIRRVPDRDVGQAWLTNDPAAGGSHLPDLTVITQAPGGFFVGSRGHHVDVGGLTPGSMPPHSRSLADEGVLLRQVPMLEGGRMRDLRPALDGCRQVDTVIADLEAQVAANAHAARRLKELGGSKDLARWMAALQDLADASVGRLLDGLHGGRAEDDLDGIPLKVALSIRDGALHVDFGGTGGPHPGNLNAPPAVVRAAVLYVLRCLAGSGLPLNEGALRRVRIHTPPGSIVHPPAGAAVVGGNVETSQRLVDLLFRAAGARASSQGTMNNLTMGGDGWSFYETIGGGAGASPTRDGLSGRQLHMTNTRATDVEVLEARMPLRVHRFSLRPRSGGVGEHMGGDGIIREIELVEGGTAALLASSRGRGRTGEEGAERALPGRDWILRDGVPSRWDGSPVELEAGDRVRIETPGGAGWGDPRL